MPTYCLKRACCNKINNTRYMEMVLLGFVMNSDRYTTLTSSALLPCCWGTGGSHVHGNGSYIRVVLVDVIIK